MQALTEKLNELKVKQGTETDKMTVAMKKLRIGKVWTTKKIAKWNCVKIVCRVCLKKVRRGSIRDHQATKRCKKVKRRLKKQFADMEKAFPDKRKSKKKTA